MIAILFKADETRLATFEVPDDCNIVDFQGCLFVRTQQQAKLEDAEGWGVAFEAPVIHRPIAAESDRLQRDPLRNNPIVGWMSEAQAESILEDMKKER